MGEHKGFLDLFIEKTHLAENLDRVTAVLNPDGLTWVEKEQITYGHVVGALLVLVILTVFALISRSRNASVADSIIPEDRFTISSFVELLVDSVYGMMSEMMGKKAAKYFLPLIGTCAFFILVSNVVGLVPGLAPPTDKLNTTIALGGIIFFATHIFGVKEHGLAYFKHFFGPVWWLAPLMLPIELISHIVRPVSLGVRLAANMFADHMVLALFSGFAAASLGLFWVPLPMYLLGCIVVLVQTLVFCLLSTIYISIAVAHDEHH